MIWPPGAISPSTPRSSSSVRSASARAISPRPSAIAPSARASMLFSSCTQLTASLNAARATGGYERKLTALARVPLLIIDDFGLKPLRPPADEDLHDLIAERYEEASTIVTSNLDFTEWDEAFPNNRLLASATVDRLRHNAYCIELEGPSARDPKIPPPTKSKVANSSKSAHS